MREQECGPDLSDLENFILQLGYSQNIAATVITFLQSQHKECISGGDLEAILDEVLEFIKQRLKPRYQAKAIDHLFALIDITVELRGSDIYFIKHLFDPEQEDARLRLDYAMLRWLGGDSYVLAVVEHRMPKIVLQQLNLKDCLNALEKDLRFAPSHHA